MNEPTNGYAAHVVDLWRSDLPGGDYGWQCHTCGQDVGSYLSWGSAEAGAQRHQQDAATAASAEAHAHG